MYECVGGMGNAVAGPSGAHHAGVLSGAGGAACASNSSAEENIYESVDEVRQRHLRSNIDAPGYSYISGIYGRLDVIGHGIGRIERHLSSSCGSGIDSHYGYPSLQPPVPPSTPHPFPGGYATLPSSSSTSTMTGHLHNIRPHHHHHHHHSHPSPAVPFVPVVPVSPLALGGGGSSGGASGGVVREAPSALSAVSVQWLLVNRWLPLWIASGDGGNGGHYYCHGSGPAGSSSSTYYHYQQQQHQMDLPDYYYLAQHQQQQQQQQHQRLQVQPVLPAAIQPGSNNNTHNIAVASGGNSTSSNTGTVSRRDVSSGSAAALEGEGNVAVVRNETSSPTPQQQASQQQ